MWTPQLSVIFAGQAVALQNDEVDGQSPDLVPPQNENITVVRGLCCEVV